jgi:uncharacterized NAD-dependent epimerase/dehydratase family protein
MHKDLTQYRIAILLHQGIKGENGKTGLAFLRYSDADVVAIVDSECAGQSLIELTGIRKNVPIVASVTEALAYHPDVLLVGIAPSGGQLPDPWWQEVKTGVEAGLSLVNGLHTPFAEQFGQLHPQQWIWDIRREPPDLGIATAKAQTLTCQRWLTVGTDMAVGKMSTSLELIRAAQRQGIRGKFLATGQGGLMIAGEGIPLDAIRVDYAAGAVEKMVMAQGNRYEVLLVEGQGSLLHPGSTATLPLLRGSQPTGLILVHRAGQTHIRNLPHVKIPPLPEVVQLYETVAQGAGAFPKTKVKGIALNTFGLDQATAESAIAQVKLETGLPCTDVVRFGAEELLAVIKAEGNR